MLLIVKWHYDRTHDAIVVMTTTKAYMVLDLGGLDNVAEFPLVPATAYLIEFLQSPPASPKYELMPKFEPVPEPNHSLWAWSSGTWLLSSCQMSLVGG